MLDGLHAVYPDDVFALIDYPTEIDGIALHEYMFVLSRASPWKSVDYLKDCLRRCSRDMKWKMDVALELELLAEREHERFTTERQQLSDEIDDVRGRIVHMCDALDRPLTPSFASFPHYSSRGCGTRSRPSWPSCRRTARRRTGARSCCCASSRTLRTAC